MTIAIILPILLGASVILQSGINKIIGTKFNLFFATFFNAVILVMLSGIVFLAKNSFFTEKDQMVTLDAVKDNFQLYYLLPGFFGMCVVMGIPFAMMKGGANRVFVVLVVSQTIFSLMWDKFADGATINREQIIGVILAIAGVALLTFNKSALPN